MDAVLVAQSQQSQKKGTLARHPPRYYLCFLSTGDDKATIPVTDTEFNQAVNPQSFCTGVSLHHPALIQNTGPLIDMSDIRPGTSKCCRTWRHRPLAPVPA